jgi:hypothetical protein
MLLNKRPPFKYLFNKVRSELIYITITTILVYGLTRAYEHLIPEIPLTIINRSLRIPQFIEISSQI